jgi:hypothetical protein
MFELIAVCDECHARLHADRTSDNDAIDLELEWREGPPCDACRYQSEQSNRRGCLILDKFASDALAEGGGCGPNLDSFEELR